MGYRVINVTPEFRAQFKHVMVWKALSSTMVIACCITAHVMASTLTLRQICFCPMMNMWSFQNESKRIDRAVVQV